MISTHCQLRQVREVVTTSCIQAQNNVTWIDCLIRLFPQSCFYFQSKLFFKAWNMKCRSQLTIFEFSCLTVIDKLELFDLTETEEAVIFQRKYLNCGLSSRAATVYFWQARPPKWQSHCQRAVAAFYIFRKIQARPQSCRWS